MGEMVERAPQLGVRLGLSAPNVASAQGVEQDAVARDAPKLFKQLRSHDLIAVRGLRGGDDFVDATPASM